MGKGKMRRKKGIARNKKINPLLRVVLYHLMDLNPFIHIPFLFKQELQPPFPGIAQGAEC